MCFHLMYNYIMYLPGKVYTCLVLCVILECSYTYSMILLRNTRNIVFLRMVQRLHTHTYNTCNAYTICPTGQCIMLKICFDILCKMSYTKPPRKGVHYWMNIPTSYVYCVQHVHATTQIYRACYPLKLHHY